MQHRKRTALIAGLFTLTCLAQIAGSSISAADTTDATTDTATHYTMPVTVNLAGEQKSISPYIYGVNDSGDGSNLKYVSAGAVRQGGNRYTGYNWETNYSNAGTDWHNSSDTNIGDDTDGSGYAGRELSATCEKYNVPYKITTLQMAGYVAADKAGAVSESEAAPSDRWKEVLFKKDTALTLEPDTTDNYVYMDEYVNYLVQTLGNSSTTAGIQGYSLDNEPVLWNDTHPLLHSEEVSSSELISKSIELASVVKDIDPDAEVFGPAFWGMLPCITGSNGATKGTTTYTDPVYDAIKGNYNWFVDYYLEQMAAAEEQYGKRLLDVFDVHFYSQDCSTESSRVQAARSLYDPDYVENSWLQPYYGSYFPFLTRLQESIDKYYPGTKIAISEYNFADISNEKESGKLSSAAIAEADALGAFADCGVYFATYWGTLSECPYAASAINLYTNYDGNGAAFGDTLVEASTDDLDLAYAYAAIDAGDDSTVTTVISNKSSDQVQDAVITLEGSTKDYQSAVVYAITPDDDQIRVIDVQNDLSGNEIKVELPAMSVAQVVISDEKSDAQVYVKPEEPDTKTVTYQYSELETSSNGYPIIPLEDLEHLKKIVLNTTVTCSTDSSWYGGGGALTFNSLQGADGGATFWGAKSFSFSGGTNDVTITMDDGLYTNGDGDEVSATPLDTYTELQPTWWKSSTNSESGEDVTVVYNSVSLIYEYEKTTTTTTTETTTTTTETETTVVSTEATEATTDATTEITTAETTGETTEITETTADITTDVTTETTTVDTDATTVTPTATLYGDVNDDQHINLLDAIALNKYLAKMMELTDTMKQNADCNADGNLDDKDGASLMNYIVFKITSLPDVQS